MQDLLTRLYYLYYLYSKSDELLGVQGHGSAQECEKDSKCNWGPTGSFQSTLNVLQSVSEGITVHNTHTVKAFIDGDNLVGCMISPKTVQAYLFSDKGLRDSVKAELLPWQPCYDIKNKSQCEAYSTKVSTSSTSVKTVSDIPSK